MTYFIIFRSVEIPLTTKSRTTNPFEKRLLAEVGNRIS